MQKTLGKDIKNSIQRIAFLKDNCDVVEEKGYMKPFTQDQILQQKEELAETSIRINDISIEKASFLKSIKTRLDPLVNSKSDILGNLKNKARFVTEICYKFIDAETKTVGYYNADGELIEERPALANELQGTIFQANRKTGTDNQ
jgi:hypothetical protein